MRGRIGDVQGRRLQARQVDVPSIGAIDRVVRARLGDDLRDDVAGGGVDGVPVRPFKRRHVEQPAIGRERPAGPRRPDTAGSTPCGRSSDRTPPRATASRGRDRPVPACAAMPLMFSGALPAGTVEGGNPPHNAIAGVDVEDEDADAAVLDVVADAGRGDVEEPSLACRLGAAVPPRRGTAGWQAAGRRPASLARRAPRAACGRR